MEPHVVYAQPGNDACSVRRLVPVLVMAFAGLALMSMIWTWPSRSDMGELNDVAIDLSYARNEAGRDSEVAVAAPDISAKTILTQHSGVDWKRFEEWAASTRERVPYDLAAPYVKALSDIVEHGLHSRLSMASRVWSRPVALAPDCRNPKYSAMLTGQPRSKPVRVFDAFLFNFELDVLDARLHELNDAVDHFVLLESTFTHRFARKPLLFARAKHHFGNFTDKILHLVLDDAFVLGIDHRGLADNDGYYDTDWRLELESRKMMGRGMAKALRPDPDDLVIVGDLDEMPRGEWVYQMKHCQLRDGKLPARFNLIFYTNNYDWMVPWSWMTNPVIVTFNMTDRGSDFQQIRMLPHVNSVIDNAGWHANRFGDPETSILRQFAQSEGGRVPGRNIDDLKDPSRILKHINQGHRWCCQDDRLVKVTDRVRWDTPWYPTLNPDRFKSWWTVEQ
jgi:hypothetical protein